MDVDKSKKVGNLLVGTITQQLAYDIGTVATKATWGLQMKHGVDLSELSVNDKEMGGLDFGYNVGNFAADSFTKLVEKALAGEKVPEKAKKGYDFNLVNIYTGETPHVDKKMWESLLEGCIDYLNMDKNAKKAIQANDDFKMVSYLNTCYSK